MGFDETADAVDARTQFVSLPFDRTTRIATTRACRSSGYFRYVCALLLRCSCSRRRNDTIIPHVVIRLSRRFSASILSFNKVIKSSSFLFEAVNDGRQCITQLEHFYETMRESLCKWTRTWRDRNVPESRTASDSQWKPFFFLVCHNFIDSINSDRLSNHRKPLKIDRSIHFISNKSIKEFSVEPTLRSWCARFRQTFYVNRGAKCDSQIKQITNALHWISRTQCLTATNFSMFFP